MRERFVITIEPEPEPDRPGQVRVPVENRLRQWLKVGLRGFKLRVVDVRETTPTAAPSNNREHGQDTRQP